MQTTHDIMSDVSAPVAHLSHHPQASSMCSQLSTSLQTLQTLGPMVPPRPDCRLALPTLIPSIASQPSTNVTYPSCMMSNNGHTGQMEQPVDTINYEPYIWSFWEKTGNRKRLEDITNFTSKKHSWSRISLYIMFNNESVIYFCITYVYYHVFTCRNSLRLYIIYTKWILQ